MLAVIALIIVTILMIWVRTRPATKEETHYREEFENGFDADYEVQDSWHQKYEYLN